MAWKKKAAPVEEPPAPEAPAPEPTPAPIAWSAVGAFEGDPVVLLHTGGGLQPCYAKTAKARSVMVNGRTYEHVGEQDGVWVYA